MGRSCSRSTSGSRGSRQRSAHGLGGRLNQGNHGRKVHRDGTDDADRAAGTTVRLIGRRDQAHRHADSTLGLAAEQNLDVVGLDDPIQELDELLAFLEREDEIAETRRRVELGALARRDCPSMITCRTAIRGVDRRDR